MGHGIKVNGQLERNLQINSVMVQYFYCKLGVSQESRSGRTPERPRVNSDF